MRRFPISQGLYAIVDDEDYDEVIAAGPWYAARTTPTVTYVLRNIPAPHTIHGRTTQGLHRFLTGWKLADHINHDGLDNRRSNLRDASQSQQTAHQRIRSDNTSGFRGVSRYRRNKANPWAAAICIGGRQIHLGYFATAQDAARAYDTAASDLFGEFAFLNFQQQESANV